MMPMIYKEIKDLVHGYIRIPVEFFKLFIDTPIFQRLRQIEQTGMRILYPSARHDRFIHSLGTYHLGTKAYNGFVNNIRSYYKALVFDPMSEIIPDTDKAELATFSGQLVWDKYNLLFLVACLMHDCGHAPFSHTLEYIYDIRTDSHIDSRKTLTKMISDVEFLSDMVSPDYEKSKEHEYISAAVVMSEYKSQIFELLDGFIYKYATGLSTTSIEVLKSRDLLCIARMIIGLKFVNPVDLTDSRNLVNCLGELLNSKTCDVDSLDYSMRDTIMSGMSGTSLDVDRLLNSLTIVKCCHFTQYVTGPDVSLEFDHYIDNGEIQGSFSGCIVGEVETGNTEYADSSRSSSIDSMKIDSAKIDLSGSCSINREFHYFGFARQGDEETSLDAGKTEEVFKKSRKSTLVEMDCKLLDTAMLANTQLKGHVIGNVEYNWGQCAFLLPQSHMKGSVVGKFNGKVTVNVAEPYFNKYLCDSVKYRLKIAYHKSSLSVLQNALKARNDEYEWIYSHHKVIYQSDYLIPSLFDFATHHFLLINNRFSTQSDGSDLQWTADRVKRTFVSIDSLSSQIRFGSEGTQSSYLTDDSDILRLFKDCYNDLSAGIIASTETPCAIQQYRDEYMEFTARTFRLSLWKSYSEFRVIMSVFSQEQQKYLFEAIQGSEPKILIVPPDWIAEFSRNGINDMAVVKTTIRLKRLDTVNNNIHVLIQGNPYRFNDLVHIDSKSAITSNFFFLYAREARRGTFTIERLRAIFSNILERM